MLPCIPRRQVQRQRTLWLMLSALIPLLLLTLQVRIGRSAVPQDLPLPVNVPMPEEVLFSDDFGASMAIDGDILAVGAPNTTVNGNNRQGLVYLYTRDSSDPTAFTLLKSITGSDSGPNDSFGSSVAIQGETLVVGSDDDAAYVFERNRGGANNWGEVKKLERDDNRTFTDFGRTVAIHGDTILVGAPLGLGDVFVFRRDESGEDEWGKTQILDSSLPMTSSIKVASFGDVIAFDGETLAISAPRLGLGSADVPDDSPPVPQNFLGAVFIYREENGQWQPEAKLFSSDIDLEEDPFWDDTFGRALAIHGNTLFVSALDGRTNNVATGKVFVYQKGSGTTPTFGQPGEWGEIAHLAPSTGTNGDAFGTSLYAVDDGLFVGAPSNGIGKVYFFRNPAGAQVSGAAPQLVQFWSEIYNFSTSTDGSSTPFGNPIAGSGSTVLIGNRPLSGGSNDIYAYAKDELFAHDPDAMDTPTTAPEEPTPDDAEPCIAEAQAPQTLLYLPHVAGAETAEAAVAPVATPNAPGAVVTGTLAPGCVLTSPDGVRFAAVQDAITRSIHISIETTVAPPEALPDGGTPIGNFLRISAGRDEHTQMESPFVIAIPVPGGTDAAHLVIAHLVAPTDILDSEVEDNQWSYIPGVYDAASKLFLARMPFVSKEGTTLVLLQHPDFESPANRSPSGVQAALTFDGFRAFCIRNTFESSSDCTQVMEATVEGILDDIYLRMTDSHIFNYPIRLRLLDSGSQYIVSRYISVTQESLTYAAYLMGPKDELCRRNAGYYKPASGFLALCVTPRGNIDNRDKEVLIHEFFHAVEYTYRKVYSDRDPLRREQLWIIEGMAAASIASFPDIKMQRTPYYGENSLRKVDEPLTKGVAGDLSNEEYLAQDFWIYVGLSENKSLGYLGPILQLGGSHQTGIDKALQTLHGKSLSEYYWEWVKHQAIENTYDVGSGPGVVCELSKDALSTGKPVEFPSHEQTYPFGTQSRYDRLPPLTAKVIEIKFGEKMSAVVGLGFERCDGLVDPTALATCLAVAQTEIKFKVYEEGEHNCHKDDLPGVIGETSRFLSNISPDLRYFVVVANVDTDEDHGYYITIE